MNDPRPDSDPAWVVNYDGTRICPMYNAPNSEEPTGEYYAILECVRNGRASFQLFIEKMLDENDLIRLKEEHSASLIAYAEAHKDDPNA